MKTGLIAPNLDLLTMLWTTQTTEVLINKTMNEQQPRVVYFASYCKSKWLLMMTTGFCYMSPSITYNSLSNSNILVY